MAALKKIIDWFTETENPERKGEYLRLTSLKKYVDCFYCGTVHEMDVPAELCRPVPRVPITTLAEKHLKKVPYGRRAEKDYPYAETAEAERFARQYRFVCTACRTQNPRDKSRTYPGAKRVSLKKRIQCFNCGCGCLIDVPVDLCAILPVHWYTQYGMSEYTDKQFTETFGGGTFWTAV